MHLWRNYALREGPPGKRQPSRGPWLDPGGWRQHKRPAGRCDTPDGGGRRPRSGPPGHRPKGSPRRSSLRDRHRRLLKPSEGQSPRDWPIRDRLSSPGGRPIRPPGSLTLNSYTKGNRWGTAGSVCTSIHRTATAVTDSTSPRLATSRWIARPRYSAASLLTYR